MPLFCSSSSAVMIREMFRNPCFCSFPGRISFIKNNAAQNMSYSNNMLLTFKVVKVFVAGSRFGIVSCLLKNMMQ